VSELNFEHDFRKWVAENTTYGDRAVNDTCSRLRRLMGMIDLSSARDLADLGVLLIRSAPFNGCTPSVKSQLKKAGTLYLGFLRSRDLMG
jgi:hypothetical protein